MVSPRPAERPSQSASSATSSLDEVKRMRGQLSLKLLRGLDESVESILFQTPFVTAYELKNQQWERAEIEGFLYVIQRNSSPFNSFILVNRKSENHLIEYITPEFQMTLDGNFIFYHSNNMATNAMNNIRGLWFFDEKECLRSFEMISAVIINRAPLSGFKQNGKAITASMNAPAETPLLRVPSGAIHAPEPSPNFSFTHPVSSPSQNEGFVHLGAAGFQPKTPFAHIGNRSPDLCSDPISRFSSQPDAGRPLNKEAERLISFFQPLTVPGNSSHTVKGSPFTQMAEVPLPPPTNIQAHHAPKQLLSEPVVNVTYDMLCRAFHETIQSDDFVKLMWRRLAELSSGRSG